MTDPTITDAGPRSAARWIGVWGAVAVVVCVTYVLAPASAAGPMYVVVSSLGILVMAVAIRRRRPARPLGWWFLVAGGAALLAGDLYWHYWEIVRGAEAPFPSVGDAMYLSAYPLLTAGAALLLHARGRRLSHAIIDASLVATSVGTAVWATLGEAILHAGAATPLELAVSLAYPAGDVLAIAVAAHLVFGTRRRPLSLWLLVGGLTAMFVSDLAYGHAIIAGTYLSGGWIDTGWLVSYLALAGAALHPSMRRVGASGESVRTLSRPRALALGVAASATTVVLVVRAVPGHPQPGELVVVAVIAVLTTLLVAIRLGRLAHTLTALVQRSDATAARQRTLVGASSALLEARDAAAFAVATELAMDRLVPGAAHRRLELTPAWGRSIGLLDLAAEADGDGSEAGELHPFEVPVVIDSTEVGRLVLLAGREPDADEADALASLAVLVAANLARIRLSLELAEREAHFRSLVQNAPDCIMVYDKSATIVYASPSLERFGISPESIVGRFAYDRVEPGDGPRLRRLMAELVAAGPGAIQSAEYRWVLDDGSCLWVEGTFTNRLIDPSVRGVVANHRDISDRKVLEERLEHQAYNDELTGLANRTTFTERLRAALDRQRRGGREVGVVYIDLDRFKPVNDTLGHEAGDELLAAVAGRLRSCVRPEDTAVRLGGDEFAILLESVGSREHATAVANRVVDLLRRPFPVAGTEVTIGASVGVATSGDGHVEMDELIRRADAAMYAAKADGRGRALVFEPAMHERIVGRMRLETDLRGAAKRGELHLAYQPIVDLETLEVVGLEALARWDHPVRGPIAPLDFIPLAEESGLIIPLGAWVLRQAATTVSAWQRALGRPLTIAVNVSTRQLADPSFVDGVRETLEATGLSPGSLELEVTESLIAEDPEAAVLTLGALRELGIAIAIDDFGTGFSSLSYLRNYPVDTLKIDRSFVDEVADGPESSAVARAVLRLAREFNLSTIAEGIERVDQLEALRELGCLRGQGYLFSRPLPARGMEAHLGLLPIADPAETADLSA
ncbi:MAG: EAL domain-containing protein [Actinobacteria bacterium]|nr:EAL domain-containing protein [Actinomycetota bacterium]